MKQEFDMKRMKRPPKNSTIINVCIIPSQAVEGQCIATSQFLKSDRTMFTLDGKSKFPHMTLYMARCPDEQIINLLSAVEKTLDNINGFFCEHAGYFMTSGRYLEVSYRRSYKFMVLHEAMVDALKDYRLNPGDPFEEQYFTPYNHEQQRNAKETGYDLAYNLYRPHITVTRYKEGRLPEFFPGFPPMKLSFRLNKICIYKADDNGVVYEKLGEFFVKHFSSIQKSNFF